MRSSHEVRLRHLRIIKESPNSVLLKSATSPLSKHLIAYLLRCLSQLLGISFPLSALHSSSMASGRAAAASAACLLLLCCCAGAMSARTNPAGLRLKTDNSDNNVNALAVRQRAASGELGVCVLGCLHCTPKVMGQASPHLPLPV